MSSENSHERLKDSEFKAMHHAEISYLKSLVKRYNDFPKSGVLFEDFLPIVHNPRGLQVVIDLFAERYETQDIDLIVALEARGFILGAAVAYKLGLGFVPIRKPGKLPGETYSAEYQKEYGVDTLYLAKDAIKFGQRILIVDDVIATGGSARAAIELVKLAGGTPVEFATLLKISSLEEQTRLQISHFTLID